MRQWAMLSVFGLTALVALGCAGGGGADVHFCSAETNSGTETNDCGDTFPPGDVRVCIVSASALGTDQLTRRVIAVSENAEEIQSTETVSVEPDWSKACYTALFENLGTFRVKYSDSDGTMASGTVTIE